MTPTPEKIAEAIGITAHAVRRAMQKGGAPLGKDHRETLLREFGTEVADKLCPVRQRKQREVKAEPRRSRLKSVEQAAEKLLDRVVDVESHLGSIYAAIDGLKRQAKSARAESPETEEEEP